MKKIISVLLALLMLVPAMAACSDDSGTPSADTTAVSGETTTAAETEEENERLKVKDDLPADLNYKNKTWRVYASTKSNGTKFVMGSEELKGDLLNETVWARNLAVEERLKIKIECNGFDDSYSDNHLKISALIMADDNTYDLFLGMDVSVPYLVPQKVFVNGYDLKYVNFDKPWWFNKYMDDMALGKTHRFLLVSDYNTHVFAYTHSNFFNKNLYQDLYGNPDDLYQKVLDGNWTLDYFKQLVQGSYKDLNGNGAVDYTDQLGYYASSLNSTSDPWVYGGHVSHTKRTDDGFVELTVGSEDSYEIINRLNAIFHGPGSHVDAEHSRTDVFKAGNALFVTGMLSTAAGLRDMEDDFGFLPFPKTSDTQENYKTQVAATAQLSCVPVSSDNIEMTGAVLEALSAQSYYYVTPAYYESELMLKYARDSLSTQMIDLIRETMTSDFIYAYNYALNRIGHVHRKLIVNNDDSYMSKIASTLPAAQNLPEEFVKAFKGQ